MFAPHSVQHWVLQNWFFPGQREWELRDNAKNFVVAVTGLCLLVVVAGFRCVVARGHGFSLCGRGYNTQQMLAARSYTRYLNAENGRGNTTILHTP